MPVLCDSKVWPSGFAAATNWAPTCPAAPALVSTTTGCLRIGSMAVASGRVTISLAPPGGNALMMVIACEGKASCANAGSAASTLAAVPMRKRRRSMDCPLEAGSPDDSQDRREYSRITVVPQDRRRPRFRVKLTQARREPLAVVAHRRSIPRDDASRDRAPLAGPNPRLSGPQLYGAQQASC